MTTTSIDTRSSVSPAASQDTTTRKWPLIIMNDDTCSLRYVHPPHTEESVLTPLRHLKDSQVGAICWGLGEDIAYAYPSKVMDNYYDLLAAGHWIGLFDDEAGFEGLTTGKGEYYENLAPGEEPRNVMLTLHRKGIDYMHLLIAGARKMGIRFYGTFRMNDCHHKSEPKGMLASKFWREHQQYRLWEVQDGKTYYNASLDYSFPEVRDRRLAAMRETLEWYDMDGIELDFCRNPFVFQPSEAWEKRGILTDFIRQVRRDLQDSATRWGRPKDLILRVPFDPKKLREAGMDVELWLNEKLIDALVMSSHWNDYNQSIEPWATRCREAGVAFYPSIEMGPSHNAPAHNHITIETVEETLNRQRGAAQNYVGQGAAGVYMFNYPCVLFQVKRTPEKFAELSTIFKELGQPETLTGKLKQYAFWKNLPLQVESHRPAKYHQTLHFSLFDDDLANADATVQLSFHQVPDPNPHVDYRHFEKPPEVLPDGWMTYWLNGSEVPEAWIKRELIPAGAISSGFKLGAHEKITITPPGNTLKRGENTLGFFVPRFPDEHDPYIMIYELLVDVNVAVR